MGACRFGGGVAPLRRAPSLLLALHAGPPRRKFFAAPPSILEQAYRPTADNIRRCRQDLLNSPLSGVAKASDFFSTSECRDLLFHIQERRMTIPQIKSFIAENGLKFIGFEFSPQVMQRHREIFCGDRFVRHLDRWHAFGAERPDPFACMDL